MPDRVDRRRQVVAHRADQVKFDAAPARRDEMVAGDVPARAAAADIVVLQRHAAKGQHQRALLDQLGPADIVAGDRGLRADDVRQDHAPRARAVRVDRADIAAGEVQKAVELVLRVVKAPGAGPAIGPAEHCARPVRGINPAQFGGDAVEALPARRARTNSSRPRRGSGPGPLLQPAAPHHRPGDPRAVRYARPGCCRAAPRARRRADAARSRCRGRAPAPKTRPNASCAAAGGRAADLRHSWPSDGEKGLDRCYASFETAASRPPQDQVFS